MENVFIPGNGIQWYKEDGEGILGEHLDIRSFETIVPLSVILSPRLSLSLSLSLSRSLSLSLSHFSSIYCPLLCHTMCFLFPLSSLSLSHTSPIR